MQRPLNGVSVEDTITLVRVDEIGGFSPDGSRCAAVVRTGDLSSNRNRYTVLVVDVDAEPLDPTPLVTVDGDYEWDLQPDPYGAPVVGLTFLSDDEIAFAASLDGGVKQVQAVDLRSRAVRTLTRHATPVQRFSASSDGSVIVYSAVAPEAREQWERWERNGFLLRDTQATEPRSFRLGRGLRPSPRQVYVVRDGGEGELLLDHTGLGTRPLGDLPPAGVLEKQPTFFGDWVAWQAVCSVSPSGEYAVYWPYTETLAELSRYRYYADIDEITDPRDAKLSARVMRIAGLYGLLHLPSGQREPLIDAPHDTYVRNAETLVWSPSGKSVLVSCLPDHESTEPQVVEVDLATRSLTPLGLPPEWTAVAWGSDDVVALQSSDVVRSQSPPRFAVVARQQGAWSRPEEFTAELSRYHNVASNGRLAVGVVEGLTTPPELAVVDLSAGQVRARSDLNTEARNLRYAAVERLTIETVHDSDAFAYYVGPLDPDPETRPPLAVLIKDSGDDRDNDAFLIDAHHQGSGFAVQPLAAVGIAVLYIPRPPSLREVYNTPAEGERMRRHVEAAIAQLDAAGAIDAGRVALSGWSRAAYHTAKTLMTSDFSFAAASLIDGGFYEYLDPDHFMMSRPYTNAELTAVRCPLLIEYNSRWGLMYAGRMFDAMERLGLPVEALYFPRGAHDLKLPAHRYTSMSVHLDWFRFWLQDHEDADPAKAARYERWRTMRDARSSARNHSPEPLSGSGSAAG